MAADRPKSLDRLDAFVGKWTIEPEVPDDWPSDLPDDMRGRVTWEWALDRQYLVQRSEAPDPIPDSLSIVGIDHDRPDSFTQHYFDSRGVTRVYAMTFDGREWTLTRDKDDFTPLDFAQRFIGTFENDGSVIRGHWDARQEGEGWKLDFALTYTKDR